MTTAAAQPDIASSVYDDRAQFERIITNAAEHLARGRRFRRERELLAVIGLYLTVFTVLALIGRLLAGGRVPLIPAKLLFGAWALYVPWWLWYLHRVNKLGERIVDRRLCLCCGHCLLETPTTDRGGGFCPECGTGFNIAEYRPPADCITALKHARQQMLARCPRAPDTPDPEEERVPPDAFLYENTRHFDRVMRTAASRVIAADAGSYRMTLSSAITGIGLVGALAAYVVGSVFIWVLPVFVVAMIAIIAYEWTRIESVKERILRDRLCLRCGYPLRMTPTEELAGICPECGRPYHVKEYHRPNWRWQEPEWQRWRALDLPAPTPRSDE